MGMFGQAFKNAILPGDQPPPVGGIQQSNWADKLMTIGAIMSDVGGGQGPQYSMALAKSRRDAIEEARRQQQMAQLLDTIGGSDPTLRALAELDPKAAAGALLERNYKPIQASAGNTILNGPQGPVWTAPRYEMSGDQAVSYGPDGLRVLGTRNPTYAEQTDRTGSEAMTQYRKIMSDVAQGNLGLGWAQHRARLSQHGYGTPGGPSPYSGAYVPLDLSNPDLVPEQ